jgi:hypothetical protein
VGHSIPSYNYFLLQYQRIRGNSITPVYVGNNDMERSRFRFVGEAEIDKGLVGGLRDRARHPRHHVEQLLTER